MGYSIRVIQCLDLHYSSLILQHISYQRWQHSQEHLEFSFIPLIIIETMPMCLISEKTFGNYAMKLLKIKANLEEINSDNKSNDPECCKKLRKKRLRKHSF